MSQMTHVPGATFTMSDDDVERFMREPRRDSRIAQTLNLHTEQDQPKRYVMTGSCSASSRPNRKRKFKR